MSHGDTPPPNRKHVRFKGEPETEEPEENAPSLPQYIPISAVPVQVPNTNANTIPGPLRPPSHRYIIAGPLAAHPTARQCPPRVYIALPPPLPGLRGAVHMRNLAFEKHVAARFTTDGWITMSESLARYTGPRPARARPGRLQRQHKQHLGTTSRSPSPSSCARGPPGAAPRHARTSSPSVRFTAPGVGEWWENDCGEDFCICARCEEGGGGWGASPLQDGHSGCLWRRQRRVAG
ncbi:hypothetical protein BC826DRAFT_1106590 [Russula brevipes]|nr:hypothetical protein BC826DRAFT_1106590 [Russula brevipes]